jgi:guanine deaminase
MGRSMTNSQAEELMREAIRLAVRNVTSGEGGPFAALVVKDGQVIATGVNRVTSANDPTAHAEIVAIREACTRLESFQLTGCELFTTCEPCPMCLGAIYWARPDRIFFAATRHDASAVGFDDGHIYQELARPAEERAIPMGQLLREEALQIFGAWTDNPDSPRY